ncbi:group 1 glycosyl transferase [Ectopseudomonas mendocina DLHK]|nr:group 1 glycosyl transferase [Pseudomonas mendocina DLHK]
MLVASILSMRGVRVFFDVHENVPEDIKDKYWIPRVLRTLVSSLYVFVERLCVPFFCKIFAATPDIMSRYPSDKVVLLQNYPSLSEFSSLESVRSREGKGYIVYLGAILKFGELIMLFVLLSSLMTRRFVPSCVWPVSFRRKGI